MQPRSDDAPVSAPEYAAAWRASASRHAGVGTSPSPVDANKVVDFSQRLDGLVPPTLSDAAGDASSSSMARAAAVRMRGGDMVSVCSCATRKRL